LRRLATRGGASADAAPACNGQVHVQFQFQCQEKEEIDALLVAVHGLIDWFDKIFLDGHAWLDAHQ